MVRSPPQKPLVIAHRGSSSSAPENTIAAMRSAAEDGADMIELDVQMTRDRQLVVFHDDVLGRTTDVHGVLTSHHYAYLRGLDAGSWFHAGYNGEKIPLLVDIFSCVPTTFPINIELKPTRYPFECVQRLVRDLSRANRLPCMPWDRRTLVSSGDPRLLELCAAQGLSIALVTDGDASDGLEQADSLRCRAWHPTHESLTATLVEAARARDLEVNTWTVDELPRMRELADWGVDGIITNVPKALRTMLSHRVDPVADLSPPA